jgi:hypothetical protein
MIAILIQGLVPPGPSTVFGALFLIGVGLLGFLSLLQTLQKGRGRQPGWPKIVFFCVVLLFFIVAGLIELAKVK